MTTQQIVDVAAELSRSAWNATAEALDELEKYNKSQDETDKHYADRAADHAREIREACMAFLNKEWA